MSSCCGGTSWVSTGLNSLNHIYTYIFFFHTVRLILYIYIHMRGRVLSSLRDSSSLAGAEGRVLWHQRSHRQLWLWRGGWNEPRWPRWPRDETCKTCLPKRNSHRWQAINALLLGMRSTFFDLFQHIPIWVVPPSQDARHHQGCFLFLRIHFYEISTVRPWKVGLENTGNWSSNHHFSKGFCCETLGVGNLLWKHFVDFGGHGLGALRMLCFCWNHYSFFCVANVTPMLVILSH